MEKYLTICQNRICFELGKLCGSAPTEVMQNEWEDVNIFRGKFVYVVGEAWTVADLRVFDCLMIRAAEGDDTVFFGVDEFAELCGISRQASAAGFRHAETALNSVFAARDAPLFYCERVRGGISLTLLPPFLEAAEGKKTRGVMPFPEALFRVDLRGNARGYLLGRTLAFHKFMTLGKPNEDILTGKVLLHVVCPEGECKEFKKLCMEPFFKGMTALHDILDYEWKDKIPGDLRQFYRCRLRVFWKDYPDSGYIADRKVSNNVNFYSEK